MPTYQYECSACEHAFETMQSMMDKKFKKCPKCGKLKLHRLIGAGSGIIFKGTGFYETDYKRKDAPPSKELAGKPEAHSAKSAAASSKEPAPGEARRESGRPAGKPAASAKGNSTCCGGGACGR